MRTPRIKEDGAGYYHVMSRVVDRRMIFGRDEKELFQQDLRHWLRKERVDASSSIC